MSLIKHFNVQTSLIKRSELLMEASMSSGKSGFNSTNHISHLPEVYSGAPNRVERYNQYEAMDLDSHVSASLDIITEFCTQVDPVSKMPFVITYHDTPTDSESEILAKMMKVWIQTNNFDNRLFEIVRNILKFGDQFFIRDPQTQEWLWIYHGNVEKVIVNESKGKRPEQYVIRELDLNSQSLSVSQLPNSYQGSLPSIPASTANATQFNTMNSTSGGSNKSRFNNGMNASAVDAAHIVHINMNNGTDTNWPFGTSILEKVFKSYKQKELIEDSIIIYTIQRSPQRRVFKVDVGDLPEQKVMAFMEQIKNSVNQRRIPSKNGNGANQIDAAYNPISILDDYYLPVRPGGSGSSIEVLPGGDSAWGIDALQYFDNKLARGLRIPSSYLPTGPEDSSTTYNDGRVGAALIQEFRFSEYCKRIQRSIIRVVNEEFKLYLKNRDVNIDSSMFDINFVEPQSFASWRKIELDQARLSNFNAIADKGYFSKRFLMQRYAELTPDEINKNHEMLMEENPNKFDEVNNINSITDGESPVDLRNIGFNKADFSNPEEFNSEENSNENGIEDGQLEGPEGSNPPEGNQSPENTAGNNTPNNTPQQ